ncbi:hypothetical protein AB0M23_31020 [Streptomyces sp. NPDC052077]|uniref:hypothetical protein n=1 Tax=Streptomyces sp. NPDC052077 TaxID=3154757 RepID=UPI00343897AC
MMTPYQVLAVSALGGLAAVLGLAVTVALALGIHAVATRTIDTLAARRQARAAARDLAACRAIAALPTAE